MSRFSEILRQAVPGQLTISLKIEKKPPTLPLRRSPLTSLPHAHCRYRRTP